MEPDRGGDEEVDEVGNGECQGYVDSEEEDR